jgi:hypothetical protein
MNVPTVSSTVPRNHTPYCCSGKGLGLESISESSSQTHAYFQAEFSGFSWSPWKPAEILLPSLLFPETVLNLMAEHAGKYEGGSLSLLFHLKTSRVSEFPDSILMEKLLFLIENRWSRHPRQATGLPTLEYVLNSFLLPSEEDTFQMSKGPTAELPHLNWQELLGDLP